MNGEKFTDDAEAVDALASVMKHKVIDGEVYVSVEGIQGMIDTYVESVMDAANANQTCMHGVAMAGFILENLDTIMDYCLYVNAPNLVPDTIPDDIMDS